MPTLRGLQHANHDSGATAVDIGHGGSRGSTLPINGSWASRAAGFAQKICYSASVYPAGNLCPVQWNLQSTKDEACPCLASKANFKFRLTVSNFFLCFLKTLRYQGSSCEISTWRPEKHHVCPDNWWNAEWLLLPWELKIAGPKFGPKRDFLGVRLGIQWVLQSYPTHGLPWSKLYPMAGSGGVTVFICSYAPCLDQGSGILNLGTAQNQCLKISVHVPQT